MPHFAGNIKDFQGKKDEDANFVDVIAKLRNVRAQKREHVVIKLEKISVFLGMLGVIFAILEHELAWDSLRFDEPIPDSRLPTLQALNTLVSITSILLAVVVFFIYRNHPLALQARGSTRLAGESLFAASKRLSVSSTSSSILFLSRRWMVMEIVAYLVHAPPFLQMTPLRIEFRGKVAKYRLHDFFLLWMYCRFFLVLRLLRDRMAVQMQSSIPLLDKSGITLSTRFIIKRIMEKKAITYVTFLLFSILFTLAYGVRLAEGGIIVSRDGPPFVNHSYWTNLWMLMTTVSTVGYGDTKPETHLGRGLCCVAIVFGISTTSLLTASLIDAIDFNTVEQIVVNKIASSQARIELRNAGALLILRWWRHQRVNSMGGLGVAVRLGITASLGQAMERWRCAVQLDKRVRFDDEHVTIFMERLGKNVEHEVNHHFSELNRLHEIEASLQIIDFSTRKKISVIEEHLDGIKDTMADIGDFVAKSKIMRDDARALVQKLREVHERHTKKKHQTQQTSVAPTNDVDECVA